MYRNCRDEQTEQTAIETQTQTAMNTDSNQPEHDTVSASLIFYTTHHTVEQDQIISQCEDNS